MNCVSKPATLITNETQHLGKPLIWILWRVELAHFMGLLASGESRCEQASRLNDFSVSAVDYCLLASYIPSPNKKRDIVSVSRGPKCRDCTFRSNAVSLYGQWTWTWFGLLSFETAGEFEPYIKALPLAIHNRTTSLSLISTSLLQALPIFS